MLEILRETILGIKYNNNTILFSEVTIISQEI